MAMRTLLGTSAEVSERHFGTGAELSGHFGTSLIVPKCLGSEVSWVRSVLTPSDHRRTQRVRVGVGALSCGAKMDHTPTVPKPVPWDGGLHGLVSYSKRLH